MTDDVDLERAWTGVAAEVWRRRPGPLERLAARLLGSPGLARALTAMPSQLVAWFVATVAVLAAGVVATRSTGTAFVPLLAPALAGAGIAYAYGPGVDPAFELASCMPVSHRTVLLVRALAVFAVNALVGVAAGVASGIAVDITFGWLVPMTAVCGCALAVATAAKSAHVGVAAGLAAWTITVLGGLAGTGSATVTVTDSTLYLPYLAVAAAGVLAAVRMSKGPA
jgi:hypothetical protein